MALQLLLFLRGAGDFARQFHAYFHFRGVFPGFIDREAVWVDLAEAWALDLDGGGDVVEQIGGAVGVDALPPGAALGALEVVARAVFCPGLRARFLGGLRVRFFVGRGADDVARAAGFRSALALRAASFRFREVLLGWAFGSRGVLVGRRPAPRARVSFSYFHE